MMAFLKYVIILILLLLIPDIYIYRYYIRTLHISRKWKYLHWLPALIIVIFLLLFLFHPCRTGLTVVKVITILIFVCIFGKLAFLLLSWPGLLFKKKYPKLKKVFGGIGILFSIFVIGCVLYSFIYGYQRYCVRQVTVCSSDLPAAFDGYRIVQFSDLHIGSFAKGSDNVQRIVQLINRQRGDMIVFTGDLVNIDATELDGYESVLSQLKAPDGVYSILGNHDYGKYKHWENPSDTVMNLRFLKDKERSFGWKLLLNDGLLVHRGDTCIGLMGTEDYGKQFAYRYGDLNKSLLALPNGGRGLFKILLSHDPSFWRMKVLSESDIQLMLAGHTHGMQFKIGSFSPCQFLFKEWHGLYTENRQMQYVNMGVGALMSYRFGAWPEISVITLKKK